MAVERDDEAAWWGGWPVLAVPFLALVVVAPLLARSSCGHDFDFHVQSWIDAATQMRHGVPYPQWATSPAYGAGEPRFVFYPPLSWMLGAVLMLLLPAGVVPVVFTWIALTLAGWGMVALARRVTTGSGAVLAAALYVANPYMVFTAYERTAFAELLAAAWMPWLLRAALAEEPRWAAVAWPVALLWLTNAPAAVMGTYALVAVVVLRLGWRFLAERRAGGGSLGAWARRQRGLVWPVVRGLVLGLALVSFYLLPAAVERRYVQIAMAIIPGMRVEDNFLFGHTGDAPHDAVLRTASWIAVGLVVATLMGLAVAWWRERRLEAAGRLRVGKLVAVLAVGTVVLAGLLTRFSLPVWHLAPELTFLQFPWRFASVLGCAFAFAWALAVGRRSMPVMAGCAVGLVVCGLAGWAAGRDFRMGCEVFEQPAIAADLYRAGHGVSPTDEYTPTDADNDQQRWNEPAWWLAADPNAPGPGSIPNPAATIVNYDVPPTLEQTVSGRAPRELHLNLSKPEDLVLNLRAYPAWVVTVNGGPARWVQRDDGLIAIALPAGSEDVRVRWRRLPDVWAGDAVSLCALGFAGVAGWRSRRIRSQG